MNHDIWECRYGTLLIRANDANIIRLYHNDQHDLYIYEMLKNIIRVRSDRNLPPCEMYSREDVTFSINKYFIDHAKKKLSISHVELN